MLIQFTLGRETLGQGRTRTRKVISTVTPSATNWAVENARKACNFHFMFLFCTAHDCDKVRAARAARLFPSTPRTIIYTFFFPLCLAPKLYSIISERKGFCGVERGKVNFTGRQAWKMSCDKFWKTL